MFLSPFVSRLEEDGSLVVDLAAQGKPRLRFGPIEAGMPWERWERDRWVPTDHDYGILIVNPAHETREGLPVHRYLAGMPRETIEAFHRVRYLQATVLQLYARWPAARDLARCNFVLLWLLALEYHADPDRRHKVLEALDLPQRSLLAVILQERLRQAQVRLLQKVVLDSGSRAALLNLRQLVADEGKVMSLRHWPQVPSSLMPLLLLAPCLATFHPLRVDVAGASMQWQFDRISGERARLLGDTIRLAGLLQPDGFAERVITRIRSWTRVEALHDRMTRTAQALGWEMLLDSEIKPEQKLGPPPIPGNQAFVPIQTVAELIDESAQMRHCVVIRARDAIDGLVAIYRVNTAGQRCTLEVSIGEDMEPIAIEEFKSACNAEPSAQARQAAEHWFAEGRSAWARHVSRYVKISTKNR